MDKKIVLLSRVSSMPQNIEPQTKELIKFAERLGYSEKNMIVIETVESAIKLSEEERLGLRKLKHSIETDNVDCVICWEPSRLARQQKSLYSIRDYLIKNKVQLWILNPETKLLNDDGSVNTTSNIVFSLFATLAENEMMIKRERFMRAKNELKQQGKKFGGATIFGYLKNKDKHCVPHPVYGPIIVDIYNHYINTDSSLNETYMYISSKYPDVFPMLEYKKGQHKIRHIFEIDTYARGNWCYPPLVTEEMWLKVHEKMSKARCKPRYNCKRDLLCRGKIYCGHCGRMMTGSGGNTNAYCCSTDKLHSLQINFEVADWIIWEETRTIININMMFDQNEKVNEIKQLISSKNTLQQQYNDTIQQTKQKMDKLVDLYMSDRIDEESYNRRYSELKKELSIYNDKNQKNDTEISSLKNVLEETQRDILKPKSINVDSIEDFETKQEFVRKYISKMIVEKDSSTEQRTFNIRFEYTHPVMSPRSSYIYTYKNQANIYIYRVNEDGTKDLIYSVSKMNQRNKVTGQFMKKEP